MNRFILPILLSVFLVFSACKNECDQTVDVLVDNQRLAQDEAEIDAYLAQRNINAIRHPTGVRYIITREGDGDRPSLCNRVAVTYEGSLMSNGDVFDNTTTPRAFNLDQLIPGWQIGIPLIKEGGRITLYIPSSYGYGKTARTNIPANSNLIFEVLLFDVQ
jgi:FKBP-type peptidyl-prolyl cis-trans isomerase